MTTFISPDGISVNLACVTETTCATHGKFIATISGQFDQNHAGHFGGLSEARLHRASKVQITKEKARNGGQQPGNDSRPLDFEFRQVPRYLPSLI